ncbi:DUF418 domain-containing protein [Microlunatus parietis]|uniref:Putative membrane protein YeiB n=1 Tax=Microlunatus parietis TaxID=682979 RepID=A0A7Y9LB36_9ACTN|nr:DUF418 domain-containing protein [Microlunatus parietis]NYE70423.1 putative membrane protein YeiB [Microlunatus parietis]
MSTAVQGRGRLLAPDFARGAMLLLILLSNSAFMLYAGDYSAQADYPAPQHAADRVVQFLMVAFIDVRVYPLFSFLVGYGLVQSFTRGVAAGATEADAAAVLRRRNLWLLVGGLLHAALLLGTDVLGAYGWIGLVLCAGFLRGSSRRLTGSIRAGVIVLGVLLVASVVAILAAHFVAPELARTPAEDLGGARFTLSGAGETSYLASIPPRLGGWFFLLVLNGIGVVMPVAILIGMWAARSRIIEEPSRHLPLLRRVAVGGVGLGLAGSLPHAFSVAGLASPPPFFGLSDAGLYGLTWTTGLAGGLGYAACFVLIAERLGRSGRPPAGVEAVAALGRRSLSGYLVHSIVMVPLLSAWGVGLGGRLTSATMAAFACVLWLLTVIGAAVLQSRGRRGPFEVVLRRLSAPPKKESARGPNPARSEAAPGPGRDRRGGDRDHRP